jgi:cell wall-associated NlpC family hydrolase
MQNVAVTRLAVLVATAMLLSVALLLGSSEKAEAQTATDQQIVQEARSWIGTPYVFGGASAATPSGVDCSGLTMSVMSQFGVSLPDSPAAQYGYGSASNAGAGDLVFFTDGYGGISNVGIATGEGTVVSAKHGVGVTETPIGQYWGYVGAKDVT